MSKNYQLTNDDGGQTLAGPLVRTTSAGITASTTQTQGQQPLTSDVNQVSVVANVNDVVTLPAAAAGRIVRVINMGANTLQIFPASGDDLGSGVNVSNTIPTFRVSQFIAYDSTTWTFSSDTVD